ncbi:MAG: hypothetical protein LUD52_07500 [Opitutae bacterium]|nr:hypothetical protein [Opitutae bacterium]
MKIFKRTLIAAAAVIVVAAAGTFVITRDGVQKRFAISRLAENGIVAKIDSWESSALKTFSLGGVKLNFENGAEIVAERVEFKFSSAWDALFGTPDIEISVPEALARNGDLGAKFSLDNWVLSRGAGGISRGASGFEFQKNGETFRRGNASFHFENAAEISRDDDNDFLANFLFGIANGNLEIFEASTGNSGDGNGSQQSRKVGEISLADGTVAGNFDIDLSIFESVVEAKISGVSACKISGNIREKELCVEPSYDFSIVPADNALPSVAAFMRTNSFSNLGFRGNAKLVVAPEKFAVENLSAKIFAGLAGGTSETLAEISTTKPLAFSRNDAGEIVVATNATADEKIATLSFDDAPLSVIAPDIDEFLSENFSAFSFTEGALSGELDMSGDPAGNLVLSSAEPLKISGLVRSDNTRNPQILELEIPLKARFSEGKVRVVAKAGKISHEPENHVGAKLLDGNFNFSATADLSGKDTEFSAGLALNENFAALCALAGFDAFSRGRKLGAQAAIKARISDEHLDLTLLEFSLSDLARERSRLFYVRTENLVLQQGDSLKMLLDTPFEIVADEFPLELLNPLTGNFAFAGTLTGRLLAKSENGAVEFSNDEGGTIRDFSMSRSGETMLENLSLKSGKSFVSVGFDSAGKCRTIVALEGARLHDAAGDKLAQGDLFLSIYGTAIEEIRGKVSGDAGGIFAQPLLSEFENVGAGTFALDAGINSRKQTGNLDLKLYGLCAAKNPETKIEKLDLQFAHEAEKDEKARLRLTFSGNGESEIRAKFSRLDFDINTQNTDFAAKVFSPKAELTDAVALASILRRRQHDNAAAAKGVGGGKSKEPAGKILTGSASQSGGSAGAAKVKTEQRVSGDVEFRAQNLTVFGNSIGGCDGEFAMSPENLSGNFASNNVFSGQLKGDFAATDSAAGAAANFKVSLKNAQLASVFEAFSREGSQAPAEGKFGIQVRGNSTAATADDLPENLEWEARLVGENGRLRALKFGGEKAELMENLASAGAELAGMLGGLAKKAAPAASRMALGVQDLQKYLSDFSFNSCLVEARGNAEIIRVGRVNVRGESINIWGSGEVLPKDDLPVSKWDSEFMLRVGARGDLAELMKTTKFASGGIDADGYVEGPILKISGPIGDIGTRPPQLLRAK